MSAESSVTSTFFTVFLPNFIPNDIISNLQVVIPERKHICAFFEETRCHRFVWLPKNVAVFQLEILLID